MMKDSQETSVNVASHLPRMARIKPDALAVVQVHSYDGAGRAAYVHYTLSQLDRHSDDIAHGLEAVGIGRGARTALMVKPGLDFFALTFGLFKVGAVPVVIDPGIGVSNMTRSLEEARPQAFIGIPKAHVARILMGWAKKYIKINVVAGNKIPGGGITLKDMILRGKPGTPYEMARTEPDDMAAILFTSGSTGPSKGAIYTHGIFDAQVKILREVYQIEPGEMDLATFPLFALFGPALGMASVIPDMDASRPATADPEKLFMTARDFGVTNLFASPALIEKMGQYGSQKGIVLPSLRRVISTGAPARVDSLERFVKVLPEGVQVFTPYGATESLPVASIGTDEIFGDTAQRTSRGEGNCVGKPVGGIEVKIIKITDDPIEEWSDDLMVPQGEIGELCVRGDVVTKGYYNRPEGDKFARISAKGSSYHRMGDVGYMDESGRLWLCGRKSHRVVAGDKTYFTLPIEAVFNQHPRVFRTALVGASVNGSVKPVLCVQPREDVSSGEYDAIEKELREMGAKHPHTGAVEDFLFKGEFPVDVRHNAKIFREKLSHWAGRRLKK